MNWSKLKTAGMISALWLAWTSVAFGQVSVPHTFSGGSPVLPGDLNDNFQALVDAVNSTNVNSGTPVSGDGSVWPEQFSTSNTLTGRNVIVRMGIDPANSYQRRYSLTLSFQNGTVLVNGTPTSFAFVRMFLYVTTDSSNNVISGYNIIQGTNTLTDIHNSTWYTQFDSYGTDLSTPTVVTSSQTTGYLCYNAPISRLVHHCRRRFTETGKPNRMLDDSRIKTEFFSPFTVGSMSFPNGGLAGAFLSSSKDQEYFLIGRNIGKVIETHRYGVLSDGSPNYVTLYAIYYRVEGLGTGGSLAGTIWAPGAAGADLFFTGT